LKGVTTRSKSQPVSSDIIKIPPEILKLHRQIYLAMDIFFVNKIPFLTTISRANNYTSVEHLKDRKADTIFSAFKNIYAFYFQRGFRISTVHADGEFDTLKGDVESLPGAPRLNLAAANEHVPEIERRIRVIKERCRSVRHSLPFRRVPRLLIIYMVITVVVLLNYFPTKGGISNTLSPNVIMSGTQLDYKKHLSMPIGAYCQVHEEELPRNSQKARTKGAICLGPSGNKQGGYRFMSLFTGKKITRRSWDELPMPDIVIARVNELGKDQPELMTFTNRRGNAFEDIPIAGVDDNINFDAAIDDAISIPGVDWDNGGPPEPPTVNINDLEAFEPEPSAFEDDNIIEETYEVAEEHHEDLPEDIVPADEPEVFEPEPVADTTVPTTDTVPAPVAAAAEPVPGLRRSTRVKTATTRYAPSMQGSKYSYAAAQLSEGVLNPDAHMFGQYDFYQSEPDIVAAIMTQLSFKAGMKEWGEQAREAAHAEMKQLHMRDTFKPRHWKDLSTQQRKTVLESHMFLKQKRDKSIKGRTVAGGNKQRSYIPKEDASSPTVCTEAVLLSCIIDAEEERDVAVIDIPNAFIQTRIEDEKDMVFIKLRGDLVDILVDIAPDIYGPYVTTDKKGVKQIIVQCQNALYGTMVASLLYYRKFAKSLKNDGFTFNPYDPCVANKIVNGKQMTILFHVDDCKLSHVDSRQNDRMIETLRNEYESIFEDGSGKMTVSRGKVHMDEDCIKLVGDMIVAFHNLVAKILYTTKRARPDTCTSISFLTKRVRAPDKQDWSKLTHLIKYIRGTIDLPLVLSANGSGIVKWWVDASFAVHPNMRGHTGGGMSLGRGFAVTISTSQKLNARSSTETEIIGVDDCMPAVCWTRYFLQAQGWEVKDNIVYQDNMSSILLEKNGKKSSSKRTKHINIRYYFITDRINNNEVTVVWCPTGDMISDYATKVEKRRKLARESLKMATRSKCLVPSCVDGTTGVCWRKFPVLPYRNVR